MLKIFVASFGYLVLFGLIEYSQRRYEFSTELSRKTAHILAGISVAMLPWIMSFSEIAVLGGLFTLVMLVSKSRNIFGAIHKISRKTSGEVYFPVAILLTALLFPRRAVFMYGILVMAISDALASIIGQKYGLRKYRFLGSVKSYVGSGAFLASTLLIGLVFIPASGSLYLVGAVGLSIVLTIVEAGLGSGLDNLIIPLCGCGLLASWLHLVG